MRRPDPQPGLHACWVAAVRILLAWAEAEAIAVAVGEVALQPPQRVLAHQEL